MCWISAMEDGFEIRFAERVRGIAGQMEIGENTGGKHWQVYVEFHKKARKKQVEKWFKCDVRGRHYGSTEAMLKYVLKDKTAIEGTRFQWGEFTLEKQQGKRTDIDELKKSCKELAIPEVAEKHFPLWLKYQMAITKFVGFHEPRRDPNADIEVYILYGHAGTGKSVVAKKLAEIWGSEPYFAPLTKWWYGYEGQDIVIVDEFEGQWPYAQWKRICDRGPCSVEQKGSVKQLLATKIVFTSNKHWAEWWNLPHHRHDEIKRRCKGIVKFTGLDQDFEEWAQSREVEHGQDIPFPMHGLGNIWDWPLKK